MDNIDIRDIDLNNLDIKDIINYEFPEIIEHLKDKTKDKLDKLKIKERYYIKRLINYSFILLNFYEAFYINEVQYSKKLDKNKDISFLKKPSLKLQASIDNLVVSFNDNYKTKVKIETDTIDIKKSIIDDLMYKIDEINTSSINSRKIIEAIGEKAEKYIKELDRFLDHRERILENL